MQNIWVFIHSNQKTILKQQRSAPPRSKFSAPQPSLRHFSIYSHT
jgi:hypothetical protein